MAERTYLTIGDYIRGPECKFLDTKAVGFQGVGIEPVPVAQTLRADPRLKFIDRFNTQVDLKQNRPPWEEFEPDRTQYFSESFSKSFGVKRYEKHPGLVDTVYEWQKATPYGEFYRRRVYERRDGPKTQGLVNFEVSQFCDEDKPFYSMSPRITATLQYETNHGALNVHHLKLNAGLGPVLSLLSGYVNGGGYLEAFGTFWGDTKKIVANMKDLNASLLQLRQQPDYTPEQEEMLIAYHLDHKPHDDYMRGFLTPNDIKFVAYDLPQMGFNIYSGIEPNPQSQEYSGFNPFTVSVDGQAVFGREQIQYFDSLNSSPLPNCLIDYSQGRMIKISKDFNRLQVKSYKSNGDLPTDVCGEFLTHTDITKLANMMRTKRDITGQALFKKLPFDYRIDALDEKFDGDTQAA